MTVSDQAARPADAPPPGPEWKPFPDARYYEASHRGYIRSRPREKNGRMVGGTFPDPMRLRRDPDGYLMFNYTDDAGVRHHNVSAARTVLRVHDPAWRPWLQACHGPGGKEDNRWPENLRTDTPDANREEALALRLRNNPPKPKPAKVCPRCQKEHHGKGRNCHECVVELGVRGARLLADGMGLEAAGDQLGYPPVALFNLAVKYGHLVCVVEPPHTGLSMATREGKSAAAPTARHPQSRLRRVLFRREASRQNSDAQ